MYKASDVKEMTGISQHLLTQWIDCGFIIPTERASSSGDRHLFNLKDMQKIGLYMELLALGFKRAPASEITFNNDNKQICEFINQLKSLVSKTED